MAPLQEIRALLIDSLGGEAMFRLISARVSLRTGVDLSALRPEDEGRSEEVVAVLEAMGFRVEVLRLAAQAKRRIG